MKKLVAKITVYDDTEPVKIETFQKLNDGAFEIRVGGEFWNTCGNGIEVDDEIKDIINLYHYNFFPRF